MALPQDLNVRRSPPMARIAIASVVGTRAHSLIDERNQGQLPEGMTIGEAYFKTIGRELFCYEECYAKFSVELNGNVGAY